MVEDTMPPIIGTAMRCMTSEPVPWLQRMGSKPAMMATTVIIFADECAPLPGARAELLAKRAVHRESRPKISHTLQSARSQHRAIVLAPAVAEAPRRDLVSLSYIAAGHLADCHSSQEISRPGKATRLNGQKLRSQSRKATLSLSSKPSANALVRTHQKAFASKLNFSLG
jgi:hypothetical protein